MKNDADRFARANGLTPSQFEVLLWAHQRPNNEVHGYGRREETLNKLRSGGFVIHVRRLSEVERAANERTIAGHALQAQRILSTLSDWEDAFLELRRARTLKSDTDAEMMVLSDAGVNLVARYLAASLAQTGVK